MAVAVAAAITTITTVTTTTASVTAAVGSTAAVARHPFNGVLVAKRVSGQGNRENAVVRAILEGSTGEQKE